MSKSSEGGFLILYNYLRVFFINTDVSGGAGLISQVLLANADALCAPVSPLMDPDETLM